MTGIIDAAMGRSRTVLSVLVVCILAGLISYVSIPKESDPDIPIPVILVQLVHQGISPEDAERLLVKPVEREVQSIEGIKEMRSYAAQGAAGVLLEFDVSFDKDAALADVRDKVDNARAELPEDAEEPLVIEFNTSTFPVMVVTLSGDVPERTLYQLARRLKDQVEGLPGVLEGRLSGDREELLEVVIDPSALETYDISQQELITSITQNNRLVAAGSLDTGQGRFAVKVPGLIETVQDVYDLPVKVQGDSVVTLADVAEIRRTFQDANGFARFNGRPAIAIEITKRVGANIIDTNESVRALVAEAQAGWPDAVRVNFTADQSDWIYRSLGQLQAAIITAISLVMIVVLAALGLRSAMLVGIAIPSSFLIAFLLMSALGMTLNMMVMFGLVLAVGILVDGAIVVVEYADRKMAEGLHRREAYTRAAKRMFWPIVSSTLTTLAAFFPMLFWPGVSGRFMSFLPITLILVLTAALVVALIFLPVMGSVFGAHSGEDEDQDENLRHLTAAESGDLSSLKGLTGAYIRTINTILRFPGAVLAACLATLMGVVVIYGAVGKGVEFFVETEPELAYVLVSGRGNISAQEASDLVTEVEQIVRQVDGLKAVFTTTTTPGGGNANGGGAAGELPPDLIGQILVELTPYGTRAPGKQILQEIRDRTAGLPGLRIEVRQRQDGPPTGKDVQIELSSIDSDALTRETGKIADYMRSVDGLIEVDDTRPLPGIEWQLTVDRERAGRFGADIQTVGATVQLVTNGVLIDTYRPDDAEDEIDIRARFPESYRNIDQLDSLRIRTNDGLIPITNFVSREPRPVVNQIDRVDGRQIMEVRANTVEGVLADEMVGVVREWIETQGDIDPAVAWRFRGADEESQAAAAFLGNAMLASLFLMFVILLTQFNSFYHASMILTTVIFSTIGVLLGMIVMGQTFSVIMTGTGIVALAGIVVNNNIVLIDTYQRLRRDGFAVKEAVARTAAQRLRPVLLTTITTMCGLLPMMFALNVDYFTRTLSVGGPVADWWVQLATAVVFGLGFATILTLLVTPALLVLPTHYAEFFAKLTKRKKAEDAA